MVDYVISVSGSVTRNGIKVLEYDDVARIFTRRADNGTVLEGPRAYTAAEIVAADVRAVTLQECAERQPDVFDARLDALEAAGGGGGGSDQTLARKHVSHVFPSGGTGVDVLGVVVTGTGTATAAAIAATNAHTWMRRVEWLVTTAAATAVAGFRTSVAMFVRGTAPFGGFRYVCRFGPATGVATATSRLFTGMRASLSAPTDVQPSTQTNCLGVGWDSADTNMQVMHNDASGACTKVDLGASFPVPTVDRSKLYELEMTCAPGGNVEWLVTDIGTGATVSGTISTDMPAAATLLGPLGWISVGGTSSVIGYALMNCYVETDY